VKEQGSSSILAEIGAAMNVFPSERAFISAWAGMSPGNNESAGIKKKVARQPTAIKT